MKSKRVIEKFLLAVSLNTESPGFANIILHIGATPLTVKSISAGELERAWLFVETPHHPGATIQKKIYSIPTGGTVPNDAQTFLGTIVTKEGLAFHFYEGLTEYQSANSALLQLPLVQEAPFIHQPAVA